jgi:hypothetical protein
MDQQANIMTAVYGQQQALVKGNKLIEYHFGPCSGADQQVVYMLGASPAED